MIEVFQHGFFSLLTTRTMRVFFTDILYEDLEQFLQVKLTEVCRFLWWMDSSWVVHNELSEIHQWHFWFSHPSTGSQGGCCSCVSALVSQHSLYPPVCLSKSKDIGSPCGFPSLMDLKSVGNFPFDQLFICSYNGVKISKLFTCRTGNQKSLRHNFRVYLAFAF